MDTRRLVLFVIFSMSILMLWESWQQKNAPIPVQSTKQQLDASVPSNISDTVSVTEPVNSIDNSVQLLSTGRIHVKTDMYQAEIDTTGADLRKLILLKHRADNSDTENYVLLDDTSKSLVYVAQTGLIGHDLPTHKSLFTASQQDYQLAAAQDTLEVRLTSNINQISVDKIYVFHRNRYVIDVRYEIKNDSNQTLTPAVYYQIIHDNESNQGTALMPTFTGGTYYTKANNFNKIAFTNMEDEDLNLTTNDGWIGLLQHYFVSAWIPAKGLKSTFYTNKLDDQLFSMGAKSTLPAIAPNTAYTISAELYSGSQTKEDLLAAAPGLEYTVDYGWLKIIATPLFWLLSQIQAFVGNWGIAIILLTILIKAAFYPLSAKSYKSMAQMRELAPRLQSMKEKFGDDRQKMQMAMMELYKTEKINPMSGCLPILVQIPVFISLYWMLLGSVELRHAPFFGWIQDLSAIDPYYILPLIMGATMIIQSQLNPPPTDPIQAKVMKIMPVIFSIFFFFFPAGLVLYWLVNNIISIWQQWYINKSIHSAALAKKGNALK
jgi:YidC/Oxa1 family membrane protein insertase